jgi:C1A family cysteine protease
MRPKFRILASGIVFAVVTLSAHAQDICGYAPSPDSPVQYVSDAEFDQMVQGGTLLPITAALCAEARLGGLIEYLQDEAYVANYLRRNPELIDLAALVESKPNPNDPYVQRNPNGTYDVTTFNSQGSFSLAAGPPAAIGTVKNFGRRTKIRQLAGSIRSATDPALQLRNYTNLYNQLPASFLNGTNIPVGAAYIRPIPPSQLQGAPLGTILDALDVLTAQWRIIVPLFPPSPVISPVSCSAEVGVNAMASSPEGEVNYGDETPLAGTCRAPEAYGLYANFDFVNKNAVSCVKDQGNRGTCGVFAATSAVEELITLNTASHDHVNLSEQDFWENLTLNWTKPPQYFEDGYDAGDALSLALVNNYQFAYENQWDYNPSYSQPTTGYEYVNTCENYPYPLLEPACSDSSPQAVEFCTTSGSLRVERCAFLNTTLPARSPYSIGPGSFFAPDQANASSKSSVVGSITDIWIASGVPPSPCSGCPPAYGSGPHPDVTVNSMILALVMNNTVILGFEETDGFGMYYYTPCCDATLPCPTCTPPTAGGDLTTDAGGHNIHVIGYIDNSDISSLTPPPGPGPAPGGGYFILKNSWGACTGDAGYFYMPADYVKKRAQAVYVITPGS